MTEREKVFKGLQGIFRCVSPVNHTCGDCPYQDNHVGCIRRVLNDAIALLKAQEPVEPTWRRGYAYCGKCGFKLHWIVDKNNYCSECGGAVKWQ